MGYDSDEEVDYFTALHVLCKEYGTLPGPGGVLDQDAYTMYGLLTVIQSVAEAEQKKAKEQEMKAKARPGAIR